MNSIRIESLLPAVQEGKAWSHRFTKKEYPQAFQEYQARFAPLFKEAFQSAGEEGLPALAEALLNGLAEGWRRQRFWNRTAAQLDDKQMLVSYLSPMLLEIGAGRFCCLLRDGWAARWPKEAYLTGTFEELNSGFRNTVLGIPLDGFGGRK